MKAMIADTLDLARIQAQVDDRQAVKADCAVGQTGEASAVQNHSSGLAQTPIPVLLTLTEEPAADQQLSWSLFPVGRWMPWATAALYRNHGHDASDKCLEAMRVEFQADRQRIAIRHFP